MESKLGQCSREFNYELYQPLAKLAQDRHFVCLVMLIFCLETEVYIRIPYHLSKLKWQR